MNHEQLALWLQGMFEYRDVQNISHKECREMLQGIKDHVALTFKKVTPPAKVEDKPLEYGKSLKDILERHPIKPVEVKPIWPGYSPHPAVPLPYSPQDKFWLDQEKKSGLTVMC